MGHREELFRFQREGACWLAGRKYAYLADEMGLGKTVQAISAVDSLGAYPALVICPAIGRMNWLNEWSKFSARTVKALPILTARPPATAASSDVIFCSYDLATASDVFSMLSARRWGSLLLDEAHYLKEPDARRSQHVLGGQGLVHRADRTWALSGTPTPNHAGELWPWLYTTGVTSLAYRAFFDRYCVEQTTRIRTARGSREITKVVGGKNYDELADTMAPHILRRTTEQVFPDMPPIVHADLLVEPAAATEVCWEAAFPEYMLRRNPMAELAETVHAGQSKLELFLSTLAPDSEAAQKVLAGFRDDPQIKYMRRWIGLTKVPPLVELVSDELERREYDKIVIFAWHRDTIELLRDGLKRFGSLTVYGGTPALKRDFAVKSFQNDPKYRVFVGQIMAAGTTITLTAANHVLMAEADWTDDYNTQALKRCHRIGQTKPVFVRWAAVANSIDQRIMASARRKAKHNLELLGGLSLDKNVRIDPFS